MIFYPPFDGNKAYCVFEGMEKNKKVQKKNVAKLGRQFK